MTPEQFIHWLSGFAELSCEPPTVEQWDTIKERLGAIAPKAPLFRTPVTPPAPFEPKGPYPNLWTTHIGPT